MISETFRNNRSSLHPSFSARVYLEPKRLVRLDKVVPCLEEVNSIGVHLDIFATVHASTYEPGKSVAASMDMEIRGASPILILA